MNPALQGYAAAVLGQAEGAERPQLADDLAAVDRLFADNRALHAALTDTSVMASARRAVLEDLLDGRVSTAARRAVGFAAGNVPAQELPAAVTWLASRARQRVEGLEADETVLGHLASRRRVGGFAAAVFEDLAVDDLDEVEDELFRFARTAATTPALRTALGNRDLPAAVRQAVVDDLLAGKVRPATLRLVEYAVVGGRPRDIVGTLEWLAEETARARGWRVARVRAGQEVDADERRQLEETLTRAAGSPVELEVVVDPSLLAGVNVQIGDLQLDATAKGRLERLREHITFGGWQDKGFGRPVGASGQGSNGRGLEGTGQEGAE